MNTPTSDNQTPPKEPPAPKTTYEQAQEALQQGDWAEARRLLIRLLKRDPHNVEMWLLLSAVTTNPKERIDSLRQALRLDPENPLARRGLAFFANEADLTEKPVAVDLRAEWEQRYRKPKRRPTQGLHVRKPLLTALGLLLLAVLLFGGYALWQKIRPRHLATPPPAITPSITPTIPATATPLPYTPTPQPLWALLDATYTPTPLFVDTPRPREAYHRGLRALHRGKWADAVRYFKQLADREPAADLYYYLGLAYQGLGDLSAALEAFQRAIDLNPGFGPAYRARAWARMQAWATAEEPPSPTEFTQVEEDLEQALALAPDDPETYRIALEYWLTWRRDPQRAFQLLEQAEERLPDRPAQWAYYRAIAAYYSGDLTTAYAAIQKALEHDLTSLPAYLWQARIAYALGDLDTAREAIEVYHRYRPDDVEGLLLYARIQVEHPNGDLQGAIEALERLKSHSSPEVQRQRYLLLGKAYLRLGLYDEALRYLEPVDQWIHSFETAMLVAEAERKAGRYGNAFLRYRDAVERAETDAQRYEARYWRAKMLMELGQTDVARDDWLAIYSAPPELVPWEWRVEAAQILGMPTPEPPPTPTPTPTPSA